MQVKVKLYATLVPYGDGGRAGAPFEVELPQGATLEELINHLKIPPELTRIIFVNGLVQSTDYALKQDDEVGLFPPIGGG